MVSMEEIANLSFTATEAALIAGDYLKSGFGKEFFIETKGSLTDYVTEYDRGAEKLILSFIQKRHPNSSFIAEESGRDIKNSDDLIWIIDPLDGTTNFVQQIPIFGTSIAATYKGEVLAAAIYLPPFNELFVAMKGEGAYLNGQRIKVSSQNNIHRAIFSTGFPYDLGSQPQERIKPINKLLQSGARVRDTGSAVFNIAYVAAGRLDAWFMESPSPWDTAAGLLLIQESGGTITHMDGSPFNLLSPISVLASNTLLHQPLLEIING